MGKPLQTLNRVASSTQRLPGGELPFCISLFLFFAQAGEKQAVCTGSSSLGGWQAAVTWKAPSWCVAARSSSVPAPRGSCLILLPRRVSGEKKKEKELTAKEEIV